MLRAAIEVSERLEIEGRSVIVGRITGRPVVHAFTGIGLLNATNTTRALVSQLDVAALLFSGVAGSRLASGTSRSGPGWCLSTSVRCRRLATCTPGVLGPCATVGCPRTRAVSSSSGTENGDPGHRRASRAPARAELDGNREEMATVRIEYAREAEPVGTMPPPASVGELGKMVFRAVTGGHPLLLPDKLGERAAFERSGTRLYDPLISKYDAGLTFRGGPTRAELVHVQDEEHEHYLLLGDAIKKLGGDPTVVTPSANLHATASKGLCAVLADPRTNVLQCLEAMLTAELIDNDCWRRSSSWSRTPGRPSLPSGFGKRERTSKRHLESVRTWIATGTGRSAERATTAGAETARKPMRAAAKADRPKSKRQASPTSSKKRSRSRATKKEHRCHARAPPSLVGTRVSRTDTLGVPA